MSKKKGDSHVEEKWSAPQDQAPCEAPGYDDVKSAMLRIGRLIVDHPIAQLGLRVGDVTQRRDIALIKNWIEEQEKNSGEQAE